MAYFVKLGQLKFPRAAAGGKNYGWFLSQRVWWRECEHTQAVVMRLVSSVLYGAEINKEVSSYKYIHGVRDCLFVDDHSCLCKSATDLELHIPC